LGARGAVDPVSTDRRVLLQGKFATMSMDVDEDEHSIEMHLPFIYKVGVVFDTRRLLLLMLRV
jgi:predicted class III extradiol MEMO1 family dioxygenase